MPTIIIQADRAGGQPASVTLRERVVPAEAHSDHYLGQLIERVGWALLDAQELEGRADAVSLRPPGTQRSWPDSLRSAA